MAKKEHRGFQVPGGYFDRFPERQQQRLRQESDMENTLKSRRKGVQPDSRSGGLARKDSGFEVPQGYFEDFPQRLKKRIQQEGSSAAAEPKVIPIRQRVLAWAGGMAAAILLAILFWPASDGQEVDFGDLAKSDIENYLETGYEDASAYELAEDLSFERLEMEDVIGTGTREQQLLEYLDNEPEVLDDIYWGEDE